MDDGLTVIGIPDAPILVRAARADDIPLLVRIENEAFATDRLTDPDFRDLLSAPYSATMVAAALDHHIAGYATILFGRGAALARLYSLAVSPLHRRLGIGRQLLAAVERYAIEKYAVAMRLEARADDPVAQALYLAAGYVPIAPQAHYYEDEGDAVRMHKPLVPHWRRPVARVPYYAQTLDFTGGSAALLMAIAALDPDAAMNQAAEIRLWRESTVAIPGSNASACSPEGLALAAHRRGFRVEVFLSTADDAFTASPRADHDRAAIRLLQEEFRRELLDAGVPVLRQPLTVEVMRARFESGAIPLVLISGQRLGAQKQPHWVTVAGFDEQLVYIHDPDIDDSRQRSANHCIEVPVPIAQFWDMARYGRTRYRATVLIMTGPA